jgi:antitoxin MazE
MKTSVQRWGNSLAIRLPKPFAEEIGVSDNSPVEITVSDGLIVIRPVTAAAYVLDELLAEITDDNIHHEVETGSAVGNEVW